MRRSNALHLGLAVIGIAGLGLFILACTGWSGWSPDGSQLVFGYYDSNTSEYQIGMYDVKTGQVRTLNPQELKSNGENWLSAQWKKDGTGLWVFKGERDHKFLLMDVNSTTGEVVERFEVPVTDSDTVPIGDAVEWNGNLFLNIRPLTRIDLISKKVTQQTFDDDKGPLLFSWGEGRLAYLALGAEHHPEFGFIDPQTLAKNPLFEFDQQDPRLRGAEDIHLLIGADPAGSRIAATTMRKNREDIVICNAAGVQKVIAPRLPYPEFHLGTPVWSTDGKHIYVTGMTPQKDSWAMVFLADVDTETGRTKAVPIAPVKSGEDFSEPFYLLTPIALAPDGKTVVVSTAGMEKDRVREKDRALYLIDMTDEERKIRKVLPPTPRAKK